MTANKSTQYSALQSALSKNPTKPVIRRLSHRLNRLYQWAVAEGYDDIWDLCCDHGRLGLHLHHAQQASSDMLSSRVHLIDCVPRITDTLITRYAPLLGHHLTVRCLDAGDIVLPRAGRQLIVLAGVGSGTIAKSLEKIIHQIGTHHRHNYDVSVEFMLSPNLNAFELRGFLRQQPLELLKEEFVAEKGQYHEHLHLRYRADVEESKKVAPIGKSLWFPLTEEKVRYMKKSILHYTNCVRLGGDTSAQRAVDGYSEVLNSAGLTIADR